MRVFYQTVKKTKAVMPILTNAIYEPGGTSTLLLAADAGAQQRTEYRENFLMDQCYAMLAKRATRPDRGGPFSTCCSRSVIGPLAFSSSSCAFGS